MAGAGTHCKAARGSNTDTQARKGGQQESHITEEKGWMAGVASGAGCKKSSVELRAET